MSPCLVQQLFRQKIGQELDQGIVDEVLFPLLRPRKHGPRELLQDIKLTSDILIGHIGHIGAGPDPSVDFNIPIFTPLPAKGDWIVDRIVGLMVERVDVFGVSRGRRTSKWQRQKIRTFDWGTIDILNKLRELNYPQMGYKPAYYEEETCGEDEFDDAYIRLEEDNSLPPDSWSVAQRCQNRVAIEGRSRFVNNFLDNALVMGKCIAWDGGVLGWESCKLPLVPPFQFIHRQ